MFNSTREAVLTGERGRTVGMLPGPRRVLCIPMAVIIFCMYFLHLGSCTVLKK